MRRKFTTPQLKIWSSEFGKKYTDRNPISLEEMDLVLGEYCGCGRKSDLFTQFLPPQRISKGNVLEVGSNMGIQLKILQSVNSELRLFGLDPMRYAIQKGFETYPDINFIHGTVFNIPFPDNTFDVVMTNTVLIHIHPKHLISALTEIRRVSRRYILFHEYYAARPTEVKYHGKKNLLWKSNFLREYINQFPDLSCLQIRYLHYHDPMNKEPLTDQVGLMVKRL